MDKTIIRSIRKDIGNHILKIIKDHRISQNRISKLTGLGRKTLWSVTSGKNTYEIDSYILIMGTIDEIIGQKNYSALNFPYRAINKYGYLKKCEVIETIVSNYLGISKEYMKAHARNTIQIKARMYCYYLENKYTKISKSEIAKRFNLDHAAVLNALKRFDNLIETKDPLVNDWIDISDYFKNRWKRDNINLKDQTNEFETIPIK